MESRPQTARQGGVGALVLALALALFPGTAGAQSAKAGSQVVTVPSTVSGCGGTTACPLNKSGTITVTNTFQSLFSASQARASCFIQNQGSHVMYVFSGPIALATEATSLQIGPESSGIPSGGFACTNPNSSVDTDQISITGTAGDAFVAIQN